MKTILVPYHLDEHRPDLDVPVLPGRTITAGLPAGDTWERISAALGMGCSWHPGRAAAERARLVLGIAGVVKA